MALVEAEPTTRLRRKSKDAKAPAKRPATKKSSPRRTSTKTSQSNVINLRADAATRQLIDRAAAASGQNRTEFMLASARAHAEHVLLSTVYFQLDDDDWKALNDVLDNPPPANEALKAAFKAKPLWER